MSTTHSATSPDTQTSPVSPGSRLQQALVVVGIVALAFNLRPAAVSVGPVLDELSGGLGMDHLTLGVLTSLPVVAFGVFGALAPWAARRVGAHRLTFGALSAVVVGLTARALTGSVPVFLGASVVALSGMAVANVMLPSLIKLHFPDRIGFFTSLYTTSLAIGLTTATATTVPLSEAAGSWRWGLGTWALTALLALLPWWGLVRHDARPSGERHAVTLRQVAGTRLGWAMAVVFGLQSAMAYTVFGWFPQVYRDAGFSATKAGLLVGLLAAMSIPVSAWVPAAAARRRDQTRLMVGLLACYPVGFLGLALAPASGAWVWAVLIGVAAGVFPLVLTLIGLRSRTPDGTAALSSFSQAVGYGLAALGPVGIGVLHDSTGGWGWPLVALTAISLATAALSAAVARPGFVEDELRA